MATILPFRAVRPDAAVASQVAALPYDVYSREEARAYVQGRPLSFLNIDRPETQFAPDHNMYAPEVYQRANEMLQKALADGVFVRERVACYYVYELTMDGRAQTGIAALSSIDDYLRGICKKHENTVEEKEQDRIRHVDCCSAQTGPIFLSYRAVDEIDALVDVVKETEALYDFTAEDGVRHRVWRIADGETLQRLEALFAAVPCTYIADGHHRAASAVKVGLRRRAAKPDYTGQEEFNYFLSVLFPDEQLKIMDYNRVVKDLNGLDVLSFLALLRECFTVTKLEGMKAPEGKGEISMYLDGAWYRLQVKPDLAAARAGSPVKSLDVALLQDEVLTPLLGIGDPRTDKRIAFVGGIRGLEELVRRVEAANQEMRKTGADQEKGPAVAFAMYPTDISELLAVADAGLLMPPKSTWFEPKLRSGIFIHEIER